MNGPKQILSKRAQLDHERRIFGGQSTMNSSPLAWIAIAVVALATGLAIWQVPDDNGDSLSGGDAEQQQRLIAPISRESSTEDDALLTEGERARTFIKELQEGTEPSGQPAFEKAEQLRADGHRIDAYLLYFYAARQGHSEAALELGTQADPAYHSLETSALDFPDPLQASKWYQVAIDGGNSNARRRLAELRKRIELQASTGNKQAQRLMLQWK